MGILEQEMKRLAQQAGGSHKTVHDRIKLVQRFCERLVLVQNVQIRRVEQLKARHIEGYVRKRLAQSERLNNLSLGLSGASRNGTKLAITPERYRHVLETARAKDPGIAAALELSRLMGLRSQEAVQSVQSLKTWRQALERGDARLTVVFGTKGGRPRETIILDAGAVRKALDNALAVAEDHHGRLIEDHHGRLIDKPDLKSAMKYWHSLASRLGLTGAYSPHSLRYAWAQDAIRHYLAQGFCEKEALAMTAMDLGHGDGRGRYMAQVYGREVD
ncbi:integrase domain-containing protein [Salmonella enterica]|nr:DNA-binding protein [Salmonella enterica subsp. diarizonae]EDG9922784.1 DNA-binding protein [Salmonella enterica]EGY9635619.1 DNA-binding protein [Salmonella enterica subsp. enterica serovar Rough O:c:z]EEI9892001.1 DNA-binding protein [Salmonella enterica subsp. diarizonae]EEU6582782.1 DNA-binding protein [Salmonella enterica]